MQQMSPSLLLRKRMSSETLEEGDKWTQEDVQKISKINSLNNNLTNFNFQVYMT